VKVVGSISAILAVTKEMFMGQVLAIRKGKLPTTSARIG
jgi:hypothetical protein